MPNPKKHPSHKLHPSRKLLKQLKDADWIESPDSLYWQSPYDQYYFSPPGAIAKEEKKNPTNA